MSIFLITFFLIYGGAHLYFFLKVKLALSPGVAASLLLALLILVMVVSPVMVRVLEREGFEASARVTAYAGYLWMGFLFLFLTSSLALDLYHALLRIAVFLTHRDLAPLFLSKRTALLLTAAYGLLTAAYGYFEALQIRTERISIVTPKLPAAIGKLTIVQLSDVHLGLIIRRERLERIIEKVREADPDILVSTGDLVDGQINSMAGLSEMLSGVRCRFGKYAVTGNHEIYAGLGSSLDLTEKGGFRILRGESTVAGGVINIAGVDDPAIERVSRPPSMSEKEILEGLDRGRFTILLKHRPAVGEESLGLFDLQLSGHVHKGQIFPFNLLTRLFYPAKMGLSRLTQGSALYVSRGTGTWGPPIRFMAPPEVTVIELRHGENGVKP
jgi:hypothetical protein